MSPETLHRQPLPREMTTPPYGATITVYEDHTTLDLPYIAGTMSTITILHGEVVKIGLAFDEETRRMVLVVTREKIDAAAVA
jgi:hypothetical protein